MAEYKEQDLKAKIEADLADNSKGQITAKVLRDSMLHIVDSVVPIVASGTDMYFVNPINIKDSGVGAGNAQLGVINAKWNDNTVSSVKFHTGDDATHKKNGHITFHTSASGIDVGGDGLKRRVSIEPDGQFIVYGSGTKPAFRLINNYSPSGVGMLIEQTHKTLAVPSGQNIEIGHLDTRTEFFHERLTLDDRGYLGLGVRNPAEPMHIRSSGNAIRFDVKSRPNSVKNTADILISKYSGGEAYSQNNLFSSFGLGVDTNASGVGRFFVGYDDDRKNQVDFGDSLFVIASGGNASLGSLYPQERLVVGDDLGKHTVASGDIAAVVGANYGDASILVGSGNANTNLSNFAQSKWDSSTKQFIIQSKSNGITRSNQLVLDSTNGNVGFASSGTAYDTWRPLFNTHVYASGTSTAGVETPMGNESAIYIGKNTSGSGDPTIGHWSSIGYKSASEVLKINNSGSLSPNNLTIDRIGNVGIGTDSPYDNFAAGNNRLHVFGSNSSLLVGEMVTDSAIRIFGSRSTTNTAYIQAGTSAADADAKLAISRMDSDTSNISELHLRSDKTTVYGNIALNDKWLSNDGGDEGIKVTNDGKVGINIGSPTHELQLSTNSAGKPISSVWTVVSDSRVKEDISDITGALDKIDALRPVKFKYTYDYCNCDHSGNIDEDTYYYNFIAQEVETHLPEAVTTTNIDVHDHDTDEVLVENIKTLDAHIINVYLVSAIKELKAELDAAKARITELES